MTMVLAWLRVIVVTVVLIPFVYWATRFWAQRATGSRSGRHLMLLESLALTQDSRLAIVRIAGKVCVVGVSSKGVQVLGEITDPSVLEELSNGALGSMDQIAGWLPDGARSMAGAGRRGMQGLIGALRQFAETGRVEIGPKSGAPAETSDTVETAAETVTASSGSEGAVQLRDQIDRLRKLEVVAEGETRVAQGQ